jgi:hypothetical protein
MNTKHTLMTIGVGIVGVVTLAGTASAAPIDLATAKAKCDTAITERFGELDKLSARVSTAKALTADHKATVGGILGTSKSGLTDLKAKIDADTDAATLKADCGQITAGFRIYALRAPQVRLALAGDRQATVLAKGGTIVPKLEAAIQKAATNGKDVTDANAKLDDLKAKLADATGLLNGLVDNELTVTPDQWNANHGVLSGAMQSLKTSQADLKTALADAKAIIADLKA